jgi:flagellar motor switch protein FliN/FliY
MKGSTMAEVQQEKTGQESQIEKKAMKNEEDEIHNLDFILDIPLKVSVELGRTKVLVQDLLKLHKGSVIELSKIAGEPLEILVNDRVVAKGEVIVVNEKFGVRLTDIVSHAQRIRQLGVE